MRVLYVCTGNSFRSPTAEALTRKYKRNLEVESAGIQPASAIAENAHELLEKEEAEKYLKPEPEPVSGRALEEANLVVVMEEKHAEHLLENFKIDEKKMKVWDVKDPINPEISPSEVFEELKGKVKSLAEA